MLDREPLLHPVAIDDLRPTQMTVGYREVERKRREWRARKDKDGGDYLGRHMIPVVSGPKKRYWMIDNHHLARALHEEGVGKVLVRVIADLDHLDKSLFLTFMDNRNWVHPFDAEGRRHKLGRIPHHVSGLADDPYRSLAGELRRAGGYAKDDTPFSEFLWADFLRRHVSVDTLEEDFAKAVEQALAIARTSPAAYLPGWAGPHDDG
ncbi:chromosome partitioning protein ParB [Sphingomonas sp. CGMCC 1.13654]|uniref:Chromosome partitioning protein ParB n=1 Tax=Sphingomonas chungangi TaxID=2683589 RepID=A0A838LB43_9SPHN|nr:ParB-like protein [Sphingomonas chungangi]MBA2935925.1 chromosome partitioning protein ParB [Sphingomonas chungangi]MVW54616.1 chromosome partitioning protein ParB [Sphingomonas chungangi]